MVGEMKEVLIGHIEHYLRMYGEYKVIRQKHLELPHCVGMLESEMELPIDAIVSFWDCIDATERVIKILRDKKTHNAEVAYTKFITTFGCPEEQPVSGDWD